MSRPIKSVVTVLGTDTGFSHLPDAVAICRSLDAKLTVLAMDLARPSAVSQYGAADAIHRGTSYEHGLSAVETLAATAQDAIAQADLKGQVITAYVLPSEVDATVADQAMFADLTLLPLRLPVELPLFRHAFYGALFRAGSPVLMLPGNGTRFPGSSHTMVAWDHGVQAARALRQAAGGLVQAENVSVVSVQSDGRAQGMDERLVRYLDSHGVTTAIDSVERGRGSVGQAILDAASQRQADLLVMGAYGHSRLREFIVGGTTREIIEHAQIPVFMVH